MNDPAFPLATLEATILRWILWTYTFCFGYGTVLEFTHFYCLASLIVLVAVGVFVGTVFGLIAGLIAYSFVRDGVMLWPATLEQGGWRALIAGLALAYILHLAGH